MTTVANRRSLKLSNRIRRWFFQGIRQSKIGMPTHTDAWWKVMCLTGVDYFSTLGYQPGIAFLAAGLLSPFATLILVLLTVFGALPVYRRVAKESPHGQGSISMLEALLPGWKGKAIVLALLGFAGTAFIITITLSAADATAHIVENPFFEDLPSFFQDRIGVTLVLLTTLGVIFLVGFREAIGFAVLLVVPYLILNAYVIFVGMKEIVAHPEMMANWHANLFSTYQSPWVMLGISLVLFPKLALGLSGFETGVAVMPLVRGKPDDNPKLPEGRIHNTQFLLTSAALIMSVFLIGSSIISTILIPPEAFQPDGPANGRALAYLAHKFLGDGFGTVYDISTILILWFAGASAMAGLLNLVPQYLPRYGMAPDWAAAVRPLVMFFMLLSYVVTFIFKADVDAQAGAYATGVLVLITSAAVAVTISAYKSKQRRKYAYLAIAIVFVYTSIVNMIERPEGLQIAMFFVGAILTISLVSRAIRSIELRISSVTLDDNARRFIEEAKLHAMGEVRLLAHRPGGSSYAAKEAESRDIHSITIPEGDFIFLEISLSDASDFIDDCLDVYGHEIEGYKVLRCTSTAVPNAIAALLLHIRDNTQCVPHAYFGWTEGNPLLYIFKYIFFGEGETAPVAREILREVEHDPRRRPRIHVG
ncbi:MAG: hypothetical protein K2Y22_10950 [Candidatus Obscuribacterales bacterium]|nr:hypothetical protein [Candidatus Obscuribacterales bacterium]